jgi:LPS-assembly protein
MPGRRSGADGGVRVPLSGRVGSTVAALATILLLVGSAVPLSAQPASLIADEVSYDAETGRLTATGNVEVFYEDRVLRAQSVTYDENTEQVRASGPLSITDAEGTVFLADEADLSPDLTEGLVEGGRLLVAGQLQLAASEIRRSGNRYTTLHRTVASTCTICAENPVPTWAIRARRVTLDEVEERVYFEGARFEILGLPVAYVPAISIPDPRVSRASGFLLPAYQQSDIYGSGVKIPYYSVLGRSSDATVTPFLTTDGAALVEGQYRRRYSSGDFDFWGVFAIDDGTGDGGRGALDTSGDFALNRGYTLDFDLKYSSDKSFLQEFDYSDADRLTSTAGVQRVRAQDFFRFGAIGFESLREDEDTATVPFVFPDFQYARHGSLAGRIGGLYGLEANALGITRRQGRDVFRVGGGGKWERRWILPQGIISTTTLAGDFELYNTQSDPDMTVDGTRGRMVPVVAAEVRWPLLRTGSRASQVIEPIAQVIYSETIGVSDVPNEDSQLPQLDATNLFSLNRYPGLDRIETGFRANLGVQYTRYDPSGWTTEATLGRVLRGKDDNDFPAGTGLVGRWSDYVAAISFVNDTGLIINDRALFNEELSFERNEFALGFDGDMTDVVASYTYFAADDSNEILGPQPEINEVGLEASYRFHPNWEVRGLWRYDVAAAEALRAEGGITYGNECAEFELSVSRRYTSSNNLPPSTSIKFGIQLAGLGDAESRDWPSRTCRLRGI